MEKNVFESFIKFILIFKKFSPTFLGFIDEITDILYYVQTDFANNSLKYLCLFFMIFSAFLHFMIWNIYAANQELHILRID